MRKIFTLQDDWLFEKDGVCQNVSIPHTWNGEDGQGTSAYYRGECKYEKHFAKPEYQPGQRVYLEFRGVNSSARVLVNGKGVAVHDGGYSTFRADITEQLKEKNTLTVYADNSPNDRVYPQRADFTFYGGIYRDIYMLLVDETHFDLDFYGGNGFLVTPKLNGTAAEIVFDAYVTGTAEKVLVTVSDRDGKGIGEVELEKSGDKYTGSLVIENVHRWNGVKDPYLYQAAAVVYKNGERCDEVTARFGCREYRFDPEKGFFLNGASYPLHGVSRHQDRLVWEMR